MKIRLLSLFFLLILFGLSNRAIAATDCSECHHVDFQTELIDRNSVCTLCHNGHTTWDTPNSINAGFDSLHIYHHKGGDWYRTTERKTGCWVCHYTDLTDTVRRVWCKACHTNVPHESHGNQSVTDWATDGKTGVAGDDHGYIQRNISCISSNCHGNYGAIVKKPSCQNCHTDPHGEPRTAQDEFGVTVTPNTDPSFSDISVKWKYQAGDSLKKSFDGLNWNNLNIGSPAPGNYFTYTDTGMKNWSIVYYKVVHADASETYFPVYPPGSNAHMNYLDNTQLCASCHVTHSAEQAKLLKEATVEDLCRTCHGLANTGSRYNVDTGEIVVAGSIDADGRITAISYIKSNSGAFGIESGGKLYAGNHANTWNGAEVTSTHSVNSFNTSIAPGGGHNQIRLTCTSCHSSHPKKNAYRLLKIGTVQAFAVNPNATEEKINYIKNMNVGCGCHKDYIVPENSGHISTKNYYRHAVGVAIRGPYATVNTVTYEPWSLTTDLPTEYYDQQNRAVGTLSGSAPVQYVENGAILCITCHYAHGTVATGTNDSHYDLNGDGLLNDKSTMLKRGDNMEVCQNCHKK